MNYTIILALFFFLLLSISIPGLLWYRRQYNSLFEQQAMLAEKTSAVTAQYQQLKEKVVQNQTFSKNLEEADEAATKLHMSRSSYQARAVKASMPERYRYISSLTGSGAEATEIATLFSVSKEEAEQLVSLSQINAGCRSY